jgi:hypothetical protein
MKPHRPPVAKIVKIPAREWRAIAFIFLCLILITSEATLSAAKPKDNASNPALSAPELRERLTSFYIVTMGALENAVLRAEKTEPDLGQLRVLTAAKIRALRLYRTVLFQSSPTAGYLDAWTLTIQFRLFLSGERGKAEFGDAAPVLLASIEQLEREIESLGREFTPPERMDAIRLQIEEFARANPVTSTRAVIPPSIQSQSSIPDLGWLLNLPLAPFRVLEGVDRTAQSVNDLADVADSLSQTINSMPVETAWASELLMLQARRDVSAIIDEKLTRIDTAARSVIDHFFIRGAQLIGLLFIAALGYRFVASHLSSRKSAP